MSQYTVRVVWSRGGARFIDQRYSRGHAWEFDGGVTVPASSSPHVVPLPMSDAGAVDPEEAFVASISSCHMLWFLSIAGSRGFVVDEYVDDATGIMAKNEQGRLAMTEVTLRPVVTFSGERQPTDDNIRAMHELAHGECYIANSVRTLIRCIPG